MDSPLSFLQFYPEETLHLLACQAEKQWLNHLRPFTDPLEISFQYLLSHHLPKNHAAYFHQEGGIQTPLEQGMPLQGHPQVAPWALTPSLMAWLKEQNATALIHPPLETVQLLHDKRWIQQWLNSHAPALQGSWVTSLEELVDLIEGCPEKSWMAKRPLASAGQGNLKLSHQLNKRQLKTLIHWQGQDKGWLIQPHLTRLVDLSSLWWIERSGSAELFSITRMQTTLEGRYQGCWLGPHQVILKGHERSLAQHLQQARELLRLCANEGYFGPVGIDALITPTGESWPVELNMRQTLGMHLSSIQRSLYGVNTLVHARIHPLAYPDSNSWQPLLPIIPGGCQISFCRII